MKRRILICMLLALLLCLLTVTVSAEEPSEPSVPDETVEVVELSDPVCSCSSGCYGNNISTTCPVCSPAGADLSLCTGTLPNVTIAYTDGTWSSWNGSSGLTLSKNCTLYVNNDFSAKNVINVNSNVQVTFQGQGHTITTSSSSRNFILSYSGSRVIINDLTLSHPSGSEQYPMLHVSGYMELNNTSINETRSHIISVTSTGSLVINSGSLYSSANWTNIISEGNVTINGGTITSQKHYAISCKNSTVTVNNGTLTGFNGAIGQTTGDINGRVILNNGNFIKTDPTFITGTFYTCVQGSYVEMYGGIVSGTGNGYGVCKIQ